MAVSFSRPKIGKFTVQSWQKKQELIRRWDRERELLRKGCIQWFMWEQTQWCCYLSLIEETWCYTNESNENQEVGDVGDHQAALGVADTERIIFQILQTIPYLCNPSHWVRSLLIYFPLWIITGGAALPTALIAMRAVDAPAIFVTWLNGCFIPTDSAVSSCSMQDASHPSESAYKVTSP